MCFIGMWYDENSKYDGGAIVGYVMPFIGLLFLLSLYNLHIVTSSKKYPANPVRFFKKIRGHQGRDC